MRRVCVEFLPPRELARGEVLELLVRSGVAPMLAAPVVDAHPAAQAEADAEVARALASARRAGLQPCVWPLLPDAEGYWPSAHNAGRLALRLKALLAAAERAGAPFQPGDFVAIDLEPPLAAARGHKGRELLKGCSPARLAEATVILRGVQADLGRQGLRTLAIAYPLVGADGPEGTLWQRRCVAPLRCGWDRVAVMTYSTLVSGYSRGLLPLRAARRYGYLAQRGLSAAFPGRAGAFVGTCGTGKLGDEPGYADVEELRLDVAAARAAGAVEVAAFCLEGILQRPEPLSWLRALSTAPAEPPPSLRAEILQGGLRAISWMDEILPAWA